ncbi:hypothetical protein L6164_030168 [Bauhinia variegata]|nr:hypothetical protein L6164_030168 [Bauhinia variegata]
MNKENCGNLGENHQQILQSSSPCSMSSPDLILMELKQAKVNLGKTINDLGMIQSSVESLNKKMKKEKMFLERTREKLASKFAAVTAQEKAQKQMDLNPPTAPVETTSPFHNPVNITRSFNFDAGQNNRMAETRRSEVTKPLAVYEDNEFNIKTAEMRWVAAKKMEEAARAAEAIALAEIKALSGGQKLSGFTLPEPGKVTFPIGDRSPLNTKAYIPEEFTLKKEVDSKLQIDETNISKQTKLTILKKLEEATEEVLQSKQVLTDALNRVESANKKQHAVEEALRRWIPEGDLRGNTTYNSITRNKFNPARNCQGSPLPDVTRRTSVNNGPKPVLKTTVSMRDVLSTKQVPEEYATRKEMEDHNVRQKVALSQMLRALREDLSLSPKVEKDESNQRRYMQQRKKFGFIQISLPLSKASKKRS